MLDPLSFKNPDQLVVIRGTAPGTDLEEEINLGPEFYETYKESAPGLSDLAFVGYFQTTVRSGDRAERLFVSPAPPSLFSTLGVTPVAGRLPTMDDPEGQVVVISHWLWNDWFGRDENIIGKSIEVSEELLTIVGVMPPSLEFPTENVSLWLHDLITPPITPGGFNLFLVGRLADGVTLEGLQAQLAALTPRVLEKSGGPPPWPNSSLQ